MKKHLLGITILFVAFTLGLITSPVRFDCTGMGHGIVIDGGGFFWFHGFESIYFVRLSHEGEQYETTEKTKEVF